MTDPRPDVVTVYLDNTRQWRWRRQAHNGAIIADSAEAYTRKHDAKRAATRTNPTGVIHVTSD